MSIMLLNMALYIIGSILAVLLVSKIGNLIGQRQNQKELKKLLDKWENERIKK